MNNEYDGWIMEDQLKEDEGQLEIPYLLDRTKDSDQTEVEEQTSDIVESDDNSEGVDDVDDESDSNNTKLVDECRRTRMITQNRVPRLWDSNSVMKDVNIVLGDKFENAKVFRIVLRMYAAEEGFCFEYSRNRKDGLWVICKESGCPFYIWCSTVHHSPQLAIKTLRPDHTCSIDPENACVTSNVLAHRYKDYIQNHKKIKVADFQLMVSKDIGVEVSNYIVYRAINKARKMCEGDEGAQFGYLPKYAELIKKIHVEKCLGNSTCPTQSRFQRVYLRFEAQKEGFLAGCRPFIGLDRCHLKGYYGGQVLSAVARDANDGMFPLALAIVEQENKDSWRWFMEQLLEDFDQQEHCTWVFISDKQKGLIQVFNEMLPHVEHRHCLRHMTKNFYLKFKMPELKQGMHNCAYSTGETILEQRFKELEALNKDAYLWLHNRPPQSWCKAFFTNQAKCAAHNNNLSESFNALILKGRDLPIVGFCEFIRMKLMKWFVKKREQVAKHNQLLCPKIMKKLDKLRRYGRNLRAFASGHGIYEVSNTYDTFMVDIKQKTCSCMKWQLSGIPCKHACVVLQSLRKPLAQYVDNCYSTKTFSAIYAGQIYPIEGLKHCQYIEGDDYIMPPYIRKPPGRPRTRRRRGVAENEMNSHDKSKASRKKTIISCSRCGVTGHNKVSCGPKDYGECSKKPRREPVGTGAPYAIVGDEDQVLRALEKKRQNVGIKKFNDKVGTQVRKLVTVCTSQPEVLMQIERNRVQTLQASGAGINMSHDLLIQVGTGHRNMCANTQAKDISEIAMPTKQREDHLEDNCSQLMPSI